MKSQRVALLVFLTCFLSNPAQAHFRCLGDEDKAVEPTATVDSKLEEKNEQLWTYWYDNLLGEFARRVNLIYASVHPAGAKQDTVAHLILDVDSKLKNLKIHSLKEDEFSAFCKDATDGVLDIQSFAIPCETSVNPRKNLLLVFQNNSAISEEVKPQTLSSSDVNYLLRLDSNKIKSLLNLSPDQLRAAINSGQSTNN